MTLLVWDAMKQTLSVQPRKDIMTKVGLFHKWTRDCKIKCEMFGRVYFNQLNAIQVLMVLFAIDVHNPVDRVWRCKCTAYV